jgi:hypothetical protein
MRGNVKKIRVHKRRGGVMNFQDIARQAGAADTPEQSFGQSPQVFLPGFCKNSCF